MKLKIEIDNLNALQEFAKSFAKLVKKPMVILLKGDLGAGKTTFVKEIALALGCKDMVTSPTFTLLNVYDAQFPIYHFDMYRLTSAEEAMSVGFEEYFDKKTLDGVCFVEWPENVEGLINDVDYVITIEKKSDGGRSFVIEEMNHAGN